MTERNIQIDALRGFAIILVIMGHVIAYSPPDNFDHLLVTIIYSFHMPLFFMISGYLVFSRFGPSTAEWVKKKFLVLVVPYLMFSILYFFVLPGSQALNHITFDKLIYAIFAFTKPDSAWFLPVLFETLVVLAFIIVSEKVAGKLVYPVYFLIFLAVLPLMGVSSIPDISQIVLYSPSWVFG